MADPAQFKLDLVRCIDLTVVRMLLEKLLN